MKIMTSTGDCCLPHSPPSIRGERAQRRFPKTAAPCFNLHSHRPTPFIWKIEKGILCSKNIHLPIYIIWWPAHFRPVEIYSGRLENVDMHHCLALPLFPPVLVSVICVGDVFEKGLLKWDFETESTFRTSHLPISDRLPLAKGIIGWKIVLLGQWSVYIG